MSMILTMHELIGCWLSQVLEERGCRDEESFQQALKDVGMCFGYSYLYVSCYYPVAAPLRT